MGAYGGIGNAGEGCLGDIYLFGRPYLLVHIRIYLSIYLPVCSRVCLHTQPERMSLVHAKTSRTGSSNCCPRPGDTESTGTTTTRLYTATARADACECLCSACHRSLLAGSGSWMDTRVAGRCGQAGDMCALRASAIDRMDANTVEARGDTYARRPLGLRSRALYRGSEQQQQQHRSKSSIAQYLPLHTLARTRGQGRGKRK